MSTLLLAKLLVAPSFVVVVTLVARRLGPAAAGLLAALPVVAGPILALMVVEQGVAFGQRAALASAVGAASTMGFTLAYSVLARRVPPLLCLPLAYGVFGALTLVASTLPMNTASAVGIPAVTWVLVLGLFPVPTAELPVVTPWRWDLPVRALATMALVYAITGAAGALGPELAGLVAPAPIATAVLAVFTHRQSGPDAVAVLLRSLTRGMASFTVFLLGVGYGLGRLGVAPAFGAALAAALAVQALVLRTGLGHPRRR